MSTYPNPKVEALLNGQISIASGTFTPNDFLDLALAALDQGGLPASAQAALAHVIDEYRPDCEHRDADGEQCDLAMGHKGRHGFACSDAGCCEPRGEANYDGTTAREQYEAAHAGRR